ncbi:MAG: hypothetical protein MUC32_01705 [Burkholderiaceae bacterium]|nr:hypothetical protein [Burkholderiaceae bacterium]
MPSRRWICLLLSVALAGCATRAVDTGPDPSDPTQFVTWTCDAMADELERVQQRAADVAHAADPRQGNDVIALGLGLRVFWPALFAMRPQGPDAAELARLKRRHDALRATVDARGCGEPLHVLGARRASLTPLVEGERAVYEQRTSPRRPTTELGLRMTSLRRTELDFAADVDGQLLLEVWAQDRAGNLLASPKPPQADAGLLYWTRLLPRELELGDVVAGELRHTSGAVARVRGQVIATGLHTALGRPFDAAVIELFGDVAAPAGGERVDGVMVVERKVGLLLRLDLRSGTPAFALRRTLVRIEPAP